MPNGCMTCRDPNCPGTLSHEQSKKTKKRRSTLTRSQRALILELTEALYWAVRIDWDQTNQHDDEDELIERVEKLLHTKFPLGE